ncbi:TPA: hypothetical protein HA273_02855 [Candidatus Bathyarchaeota archaeon]|nr:hypothetical protein [Candidatus Bathyarchaeota archaeon]HIJ07895.1 hypothetical protein [Candidatus Bathyarchaeota archaeon]
MDPKVNSQPRIYPNAKRQTEKVLEAARLAPSAANNQPLHLIVVTDIEK